MAETLAGHIQKVAMRIMSDGEFAAQVRRAGVAAARGGAGSAAFAEYFEIFASTPGELAGLGAEGSACPCDSNTWFTVSSIAGPLYTCCATTTTTTTSGNFFALQRDEP
ncbi:MAG: hypothetical protein JO299_21225 [Gammaproteobacteria bacterium]|nr:hypothetical protein [Gammaproteobacteria bacterium]